MSEECSGISLLDDLMLAGENLYIAVCLRNYIIIKTLDYNRFPFQVRYNCTCILLAYFC